METRQENEMNNMYHADSTIGTSEMLYLSGICEYSKKRRSQMLLRLKRRNGYQTENFRLASNG